MGDLRKDVFICLDCEATGLDTQNDAIIELAVVKFTFDKNLVSWESLVNPMRVIPPESTEVHRITDAMVADKPTIQEVLPHAFSIIDSHTIVGHNIGYDIALLIAAAKNHNIPCPIDPANTLDTVRLARLRASSQSNKLEHLREYYNIPEEGAHRAMNDVIVNIQVFKHLVQKFKTTQEVKKRLQEPIALPVMPLGKHKGLPFSQIPIDYLYWASQQNFDKDLLFSINQEKRKRKKRKPFGQSANPFADL